MPGMAARKRKTGKAKGLSDKQKRFVAEYLIDLNGAAAYRRAGYAPKTDAAAEAAASRLLRNVKVAEAIKVAQAERSKRTEVTQDYVLTRLKREAEFDGEGSSHSARVSALKLLGDHLGLFKQEDAGDKTPTVINTIEVHLAGNPCPPPA